MNGEIVQLAYQLNELLKENELIKKVYVTEKAMMENEKFQLLIVKKNNCEELYNNATRFNNSSDNELKALHQVKLEIDSLKEVVTYRKAYLEAKQYLSHIAHLTFDNLSELLKINSLFGE